MFNMKGFNITFLSSRLLFIALISIGLMPVLPNKLKPVPVLLFALVAVSSFFMKRKNCYTNKKLYYPIILSALIILYIISFSYSENMKIAGKRIETGLSLFLMPWFAFFIFQKLKVSKRQLLLVFQLYFWSSVVYAIMIIVFFYTIGYYQGEQTLEFSLSYLDGMLKGYSQHPIYASMIFAIALFFIPYLWNQYVGPKKYFIVVGSILLFYVLFLLFRKGVVIALVLPTVVFIYKNKKTIGNIKLLVLALVLLIFSILFRDKISNRVGEMFSKSSFEQVDINNSTSMRFAVYECVVEDIKKSPIIGHGIGDGYDLIAACLEYKHDIIFKDRKQKKNAHNQYLGIWVYVGIIGLLLFLTQLFLYFKTAVKSKNMLFIQLVLFFSIIMLTENILDRQTGVLLFALFLNLFFFMHLAEANSSFKVNQVHD
jgi:O-antigen ligase